MTARYRSGFAGLILILATGSAAEQETLKFRLVTKVIAGTFFDAPNVEGRGVGATSYGGVAVFDDGRLANKEFVVRMGNRGAEGGHSTYTFENGDSLTQSFTGGWGAEGDGGDYVILSGTGAYEGATGTGRFDAAENPWESASLYDASITVMKK